MSDNSSEHSNQEGENVLAEDDIVDNNLQNNDEGEEMANPVKGVSLPEFWGEPQKDRISIEGWIKQVDAYKTLANIADGRTAQLAYMSLRGKAAQWALNATHDDENVWATWDGAAGLKKGLQDRYFVRATLSQMCQLRDSLVMQASENVSDFYDRCVMVNHQLAQQQWEPVVANEANNNAQAVAADAAARRKHIKISLIADFSNGLKEEIKTLLMVNDVDTPEEMLKFAIRIEASLNDKKKMSTPHYEINAISQQTQRRPQPNDFCFNCKEKGHWAPNCPKPRQNWGQNRGNRGRGRFNNRGNPRQNFRYSNNNNRNNSQQQQQQFKAFQVNQEQNSETIPQKEEKPELQANQLQLETADSQMSADLILGALNPYRL